MVSDSQAVSDPPNVERGDRNGLLTGPSHVVVRNAYAWLVPGYAVLLVSVVLGGIERQPYDDSYFFKRFALNLLDHGLFAWNASDGPVYGNTSQLFQLVVTATTAFTRTHTLFAVRLLLAFTLLCAFTLSLRTGLRRGSVVAPALGFCSPVILFSVLSGMETAVAFALLALFCDVIDPEQDSEPHWLIGPLLVVAVWLTRPDAILLAGSILVGLNWLQRRRFPAREVLVIVCLVAVFLVTFRLYYGTALPLPFYAKQRAFSPYDAHFIELSDQMLRVRFSVFAWAALPLFLLAMSRVDAVNLILVAAVGLFETYHLCTTIDVMGMQGRFYAPALPILIFAASRAEQLAWSARRAAWLGGLNLLGVGLLVAVDKLPTGSLDNDENLTRAFYVLGTMAGTAALVLPLKRAPRLGAGVMLALAMLATVVSFHPKHHVPPTDSEYVLLHEGRFTVYRGLETLRACFGDAIDVYHSEVGVVGMRFEHGKVTDLAGLLSRDWMFRDQTFDATCLAERPQGIFLPHRNYVALNQEIQRSRCIRGYVRVIAESSSPLYVRADLYPRYRACADAAL
jgi:hypothetical protein